MIPFVKPRNYNMKMELRDFGCVRDSGSFLMTDSFARSFEPEIFREVL